MLQNSLVDILDCLCILFHLFWWSFDEPSFFFLMMNRLVLDLDVWKCFARDAYLLSLIFSRGLLVTIYPPAWCEIKCTFMFVNLKSTLSLFLSQGTAHRVRLNPQLRAKTYSGIVKFFPHHLLVQVFMNKRCVMKQFYSGIYSSAALQTTALQKLPFVLNKFIASYVKWKLCTVPTFVPNNFSFILLHYTVCSNWLHYWLRALLFIKLLFI